MPDGWWQLTVEVPAALADDASALLVAGGAAGVHIVDGTLEAPHFPGGPPADVAPAPGRARLVVSYELERSKDGVGAAGRDALSELGLESAAVEIVRRSDDDWAEAWKRYFKPLRVGARVWIVPSWEKHTAAPGELVITLDPGMAFGTGQHATTALCMSAIEKILARGPARVLDVGCGSGILAIAARMLGAERVVAIDNDHDAVRATRENVALNEVDVTVSGDDVGAVGEQFGLVVANILATVLVELAAQLIARCAPGGHIVLSGILAEQRDDLLASYRKNAAALGRTLEPVDELTREGWVALVLRA